MALKTFRPLTPTNRFKALPAFDGDHQVEAGEALVETKQKTGGRNNNGRITTRHIGGGHKQKYRIIDFKRRKRGVEAEVIAIEYDPNRTCRIALLAIRRRREGLHPRSRSVLAVGAKVTAGESVEAEGRQRACRSATIPLGTVDSQCRAVSPVAAARSPAAPASRSSSTTAKAITRWSRCLPAKSARFT